MFRYGSRLQPCRGQRSCTSIPRRNGQRCVEGQDCTESAWREPSRSSYTRTSLSPGPFRKLNLHSVPLREKKAIVPERQVLRRDVPPGVSIQRAHYKLRGPSQKYRGLPSFWPIWNPAVGDFHLGCIGLVLSCWGDIVIFQPVYLSGIIPLSVLRWRASVVWTLGQTSSSEMVRPNQDWSESRR